MTLPEYKTAADMQLEIAKYFLAQLESVYDPSSFGRNDQNSIKTQAYFEGCIRAAYSCLDKLCDGRLKGDGAALKAKLQSYGLRQAENQSAFVDRLRTLRNDVTHNHTTKASDGSLVISISTMSGTDFGDIKSLAKRAVDLARNP